jgi:hypothetical protein
MATLAAGKQTLLDVTKRLDPDGGIAAIGELLSQTNSLLEDMPFLEGNLPTGHRATIRTGLPEVYWRKMNKGVPSSKSTTAQVDEACASLEAWCNVDKDIAALNGNTPEFRLSEARAFLEAMNQEMAATAFYGNSATAPEEFSGLATRYSSSTAGNGQNVIKAGGSDTDNMSIWLIAWGPETVHGIYPKGSKAGLVHEDLGLETVEDSDGNKYRAYQDHWEWKTGLVVKDWRYAVRVCNIDTSAIVADIADSTYTFDLSQLLIRALHRLPNMSMGRPVFYVPRTLRTILDIQALGKASNTLRVDNFDGQLVTTFRGIPVKTVDALTESEALVA